LTAPSGRGILTSATRLGSTQFPLWCSGNLDPKQLRKSEESHYVVPFIPPSKSERNSTPQAELAGFASR